MPKSDLFSNFNLENIKNVLGDHGMSLGITCVLLHDHRRYKFCCLCATGRFALGYLTIVHHLLQRLLDIATSYTLQINTVIPLKFRRNLNV